MVMNGAHKNIHTHKLNIFQISTYSWVLLGFSMTNVAEHFSRKIIIMQHVKPGSSNVQGCD